MTVAAAGSRTGAAAISRDFGARAFARLGNLAAMLSPIGNCVQAVMIQGTSRLGRRNLGGDDNIENYIVNNIQTGYHGKIGNKRADRADGKSAPFSHQGETA
jgi:hypothetical protein